MTPHSLAFRLHRAVRGTPMSRRGFLQKAAAASVALMLGDVPAFARAKARHSPRVLIIGAGFGGLSCGYQLRRLGWDVTILEARERISGRVLSTSKFVRGATVELGGELIGVNHHTWVAYAKLFGLRLREISDKVDDQDPLFLEGKLIPRARWAELIKSVDEVFHQIDRDSMKITDPDRPWLMPDAARLDRLSVRDVLDAMKVSPATKAVARAILSNDNVTPLLRQSYLGLLASVAGGGGETYWEDSETHRCAGGNQRLATKLAQAIGGERILLNQPVSLVKITDAGAQVTTADGKRREADYVVLTVPPAAWKQIRFEPGIPSHLVPTYGPAVKYLSRVKSRFWRRDNLGQYALTDAPIGMSWDATDGQPGAQGACLTCFAGGTHAQDVLDTPAPARRALYTKYLDQIFPGYSAQIEQSLLMTWPEQKWTACGYTAYSPGQVTAIGPALYEGLHERLLFAGEFSSSAFRGFMEGALHSGLSLARRLAKKHGVAVG